MNIRPPSPPSTTVITNSSSSTSLQDQIFTPQEKPQIEHSADYFAYSTEADTRPAHDTSKSNATRETQDDRLSKRPYDHFLKKATTVKTAVTGNSSLSSLERDPNKTTIYGSDTTVPPTTSYTLKQRKQHIDAYANRLMMQIGNIETGSESKRNDNLQKVRLLMKPKGYFSAGLIAAAYDPNEQIRVTFNAYRKELLGGKTHLVSSEKRPYFAWEIAAGALAHDKVQKGGPINYQTMDFEPEQKSKVNHLELLGTQLQDHWENDIAAPMRGHSRQSVAQTALSINPVGDLAVNGGIHDPVRIKHFISGDSLHQRMGKADAFVVRGTLQSLSNDKVASAALSPEAQAAVKRTLTHNGQVIIPNVYGYPLAGYAFIPYTPYDENYQHRPNQGLMIDLENGAVREIRTDAEFANWAAHNRNNLLRSFNARDRQGGKDAHWPKAGDLLDDLIAGKNVTVRGYSSLVSDQAIPVRETFNYTRARGEDYALKHGDLNNGIASHFQAVNTNNALWSDQTEVFGSSQQSWKDAKEFWGNTFGYVPILGNAGNIGFGVHDGIYGKTADDRVGGNAAAVISGLQLAHELAPTLAETQLGEPSINLDTANTKSYSWRHNAQTNDLELVRVPPKNELKRSPVIETPPVTAKLPTGAAADMQPVLLDDETLYAYKSPNQMGHYELYRIDPNAPEKIMPTGQFAAKEGAQWQRLGLKGGVLEDISDGEYELASESIPAAPYTEEERNFMRQDTAYFPKNNRLGSYNRANNGKYPIRDHWGRPLRIKLLESQSHQSTSGVVYASEQIKPYIKYKGYEDVAKLYEEKLQLRTFTDADAKTPEERALTGQRMVVANRRIAKGEAIGVYGGTILPEALTRSENDTFYSTTGYRFNSYDINTPHAIAIDGDNIISRINTNFEYDAAGKPIKQAATGYNIESASFEISTAPAGSAETPIAELNKAKALKTYQLLGFFATEDIPAGTELRWNYGYSTDLIKDKFP